MSKQIFAIGQIKKADSGPHFEFMAQPLEETGVVRRDRTLRALMLLIPTKQIG